ncbi:DUF5067 domain-containing protein [Adlercreutzia muris]|uniref:non-specific serine/threonine protein kinase n=1 Tax=Adlercreutzia muris TaxID=1796610 RepID=A0A7C8BT59_9ACTN|nr:DUF5067 domain-containing protein [Adlercreutzia muris]KAB1641499.1 DUF5067 domain-containing protein [Adlercreutzia muris]MCR2029106.1 DUF5067 domain-containing protein [Adlercreutzia muris]
MEKKPTSGLAVAGLVLGVLALLVTAAMYGGASAASDGSSESTPVAEQGASQDAPTRAEQGASQDAPARAEQEAASDYAVTIDDCRMTEDYEGNPAAVVTFTFTNNSEETTSPAVALHAQVFQNGTELEMAITTDNEDAGKYMNDVKPGSSITYGLAYELEDTSDITVEVQELAAFNDVFLAGIAPAGGQPAFAGGRRQRAARGFAPPLIHRDLKPSNIVVSDGGLTIIDFGIARAFREGAGADTTHFGTRSYAPPEQFGYGQTDVRSDVYALGMLLYYLVTERDPDARVATGGFAEPDVPPMLRPVLQRACAFDPAARFSSVWALKAAFLAAMASALGLPR